MRSVRILIHVRSLLPEKIWKETRFRKSSMNVMIGNIIDDKDVQDAVGYEKYDIVTANILADVLIPLTPVIIHQMKKGGIYITSGYSRR